MIACLATSTWGNFVRKKSETEFEMRLNEHGANYSQIVTFDEENGFVTFDSPSHHDRTATIFTYDTKNVSTIL